MRDQTGRSRVRRWHGLPRPASVAVGLTLLGRLPAAVAACDITAPVTGETVTCSATAPNPTTTGVAAATGSTDVTVNVQSNAELDVAGNNAVLIGDRSSVVNLGTIRLTGDTFDAISAHGSLSGVGAGQNVLINRGLIVTGGALSEGLYNNAAAVTMLNDTTGVIRTSGNTSAAINDFMSPGGGTLTNKGILSTTGDFSPGMAAQTVNDTVVNSGTITTTGAGAHGMVANGNVVGGAGNNAMTNTGTIDVYGASAHGLVSFDPTPGRLVNTGTITAHGVGGLGMYLSNAATFDNTAGARIVAEQGNGIAANGGGTFVNAGTISGDANAIAISGGAASIVNTGAIVAQSSQAISSDGTYAISIDNTGTIAGGNGRAIWTDSGDDTFNWHGGTVTGFVRLSAGNDTATLTGLTDANLAGVPSFDGGTGTDVVTFDGTTASGSSRFIEWETVNLTNGSTLTLDSGGLTLGDSGTSTGALSIDSGSTLIAGNIASASISPAVAGHAVNVTNAGTIDLTGGATADHTLTINGNYIGANGRLLVQSVLGGDGSASDRLVIAQGVGAGSTTIGVTNLNGTGGATLADGILLVQAASGATTTASAFTIPKPLSAGAYTYYLFKGGVSAGTADNWYLRSSVAPEPATTASTPGTPSTPDSTPVIAPPIAAAGTPLLPAAARAGSAPTPLYRLEVPVYAEVPELARALSIEQIGTFHDRQGSQSSLDQSGVLPASWARVWGGHLTQASGGAVSPEFSGTTGGAQLGQDVYANLTSGGHRNHFGFLLGFARAQGDVSGFALGFPGLAAGHVAIDAYSVGGYWTHIGPGGWYTDAVLIGSSLTADPLSNQQIGATTHGHAIAVSGEAGLPVALTASWRIEPQLQLIWQHTSLNDLNDGISSVSFDSANGVTGRVGVRVQGHFDVAKIAWEPYLRANLWRSFGGTDHVTFAGTTAIPTDIAATTAQFGVGVVARFSARGSAFVTASYLTNVNGPHRRGVEGNAGVRLNW
ncbi:autotransporter outer membrane beta-barrel domain-containing protein [Paraburkholderia sp.]|uniref:autotransporter family protein n=1 Tax=Paraburkholderia sp. TaxID=1926495 RepID=UPI002382E42B|nr:autotransporter outer membrane beta-barrel domain-containing protein [Paraburkholderia sp.]MDE1181169.1 autotransporter outer membrane beta-barrel domain-containing protein [Paraburkholderia sp.]